jgi:hypothetical protein
MTGREEPGRASRPDEEPPRERGRLPAWLLGGTGALVAVAFVVLAIVVVVLVAT